jgi:hypothetical protein
MRLSQPALQPSLRQAAGVHLLTETSCLEVERATVLLSSFAAESVHSFAATSKMPVKLPGCLRDRRELPAVGERKTVVLAVYARLRSGE